MPAPGEQRSARQQYCNNLQPCLEGQLEQSFAVLCRQGRLERSCAAAGSAAGPCGVLPRGSARWSLVAGGLRFGVVVARFNDLVTKPLLEGVLEGFERHGVPREEVEVRTCAELVLVLFVK